MKMLKKDQKGFTLIELLIVVAIIGILAAIAIPQFAAYRQRAFNGSAQSDLRNMKTAQESLFADNQTYGVTETGVDLTAVAGDPTAGVTVVGPIGAATGTVAGAALAGETAQNRVTGIGFALSNGVSAVSYTNDAALGDLTAGSSYLMYAKHSQGPRVFGVDAENTGIYLVENQAWASGVAVDASATLVEAPTTADDLNAVDGGGLPTANWILM